MKKDGEPHSGHIQQSEFTETAQQWFLTDRNPFIIKAYNKDAKAGQFTSSSPEAQGAPSSHRKKPLISFYTSNADSNFPQPNQSSQATGQGDDQWFTCNGADPCELGQHLTAKKSVGSTRKQHKSFAYEASSPTFENHFSNSGKRFLQGLSMPKAPDIREQHINYQEFTSGISEEFSPPFKRDQGDSETPTKGGKNSKFHMFRQRLLQSKDNLKFDTLKQQTAKFESQVGFASTNISIRSKNSFVSYKSKSGMNPNGQSNGEPNQGQLQSSPLKSLDEYQELGFQDGLNGQNGFSPDAKELNVVYGASEPTVGAGLLPMAGQFNYQDPKTPISGCRVRGVRRGPSAKQALLLSLNKIKRQNQSPLLRNNDNNQDAFDSPEQLALEDDLRTFEEKYIVSDHAILGEGCSSVVKECSFRKPKSNLKKHLSEQWTAEKSMHSKTSPLLQMQKIKNQSQYSKMQQQLLQEEQDQLRSHPGHNNKSTSQSGIMIKPAKPAEIIKLVPIQFQNVQEDKDEDYVSNSSKSSASVSSSSSFNDSAQYSKMQPVRDAVGEQKISEEQYMMMSPVEDRDTNGSQMQEQTDALSKSSEADGQTEEQTAVKTGESTDPNVLNLDKLDFEQDDDQKFAVKIIRTQDEELIEIAYSEYKILKSIDHENIIKMHDAFLNQLNGTMYLVMDMANGRNLRSLMEDQKVRFTESQAKLIFRQLLDAIKYLQSPGVSVCHRDINPNNIIIQNTELITNQNNSENDLQLKLTLIDFNISKHFRDPDTNNPLKMMTNTGTCKYKAPEILGGFMSYYDEKIDLWSAGAVLYYITCDGRHAFNLMNQKDIEDAIEVGDYNRHLEKYNQISDECRDLIEKLMTVDIYKRYTIEQALSHKWFQTEPFYK